MAFHESRSALVDFHLEASHLVKQIDLASWVIGNPVLAEPAYDPFDSQWFDVIERHAATLDHEIRI